MSKDFSIKVNGVDIKSDTLYQVVPKIDHDAPDGFIEHGTSKILSPLISETVQCIFHENANVWDTGFYVNSPCYRGMQKEEKEILVKSLQENIVEPVEELLGKDKLTHINGNRYWNELMIDLKNGGVFNTNNPTELLHLYIAILHFNLAPKEEENSHRFKKAKYCIENKAAVVNLRQQREADKNKSIGLFYTLYNSDKAKLLLILDYLGISSVSESTTELAFNSVFTQYISEKTSGFQNIELFLKAVNLTSNEEGLREMTIFRDLKTLFRKGIVTKKYSELFLDEESLGTNFMDATKKVMNSKELENKVFELITNMK